MMRAKSAGGIAPLPLAAGPKTTKLVQVAQLSQRHVQILGHHEGVNRHKRFLGHGPHPDFLSPTDHQVVDVRSSLPVDTTLSVESKLSLGV